MVMIPTDQTFERRCGLDDNLRLRLAPKAFFGSAPEMHL